MNPVATAQPNLFSHLASRHANASGELRDGFAGHPAAGAQQLVSTSYSQSVDVSLSAEGLTLAYQERSSYVANYVSSYSEQVQAVTRPSPAASLDNDSQKVADSSAVILGFIEGRLTELASSGASEEELAKALEQARAGFQQGLSEATKILQGYGLYQGPIKDGVLATQQTVEDGLDALTERYLGVADEVNDAADAIADTAAETDTADAASASNEAASPAGSGKSAPVVSRTAVGEDQEGSQADSPAEQLPAQESPVVPTTSPSSRYAFDEKLSVRQSLDLQVRTRDGDLVTLSIDSFQAFRERLAQLQDGEGNSISAYSNKSVSKFEQLFSVQGDLDAGELQALSGLFAQVADLADEFFTGDLDQVFEQAMALQLDTSELSAMSLDMEQAIRYRGVERYQEVSGEPPHRPSMAALGDYVNHLMDLVRDANERLQSPKESLNDAFNAAFSLLDNNTELSAATAGRHQRLLDSLPLA